MSNRRRTSLWRKLMLQAAPLVLASSAWWLVSGVGNTVDHHIQVSVQVR